MNWEGTWNLEVSTPFGKHPATLVFQRVGDEGSLTGNIDSRLGRARLREFTADGDGFAATISLDLQGRTYEATISGLALGNQLDGTIKVKLAIAPPMKYTGTRGE